MMTSTPELEHTVAALRAGGVAALDTEFVWDRTFYPTLGLVQLAAADGDAWLWDALSPASPSPLFPPIPSLLPLTPSITS